jgi:uncharacterized protein
MIDLHDVPMIDNHVHVFAPDADQPSFDPLATFTLGGDDPDFLATAGWTVSSEERARLYRNLEHTMAYQQAICQLANLLGCDPTREAVLAARAEAAADFPAYVQRLYTDINLEAVIVDLGHPHGVDLDAFSHVANVPTYGIFRIEALIADLWDEHDDFSSFLHTYLDTLHTRGADKQIVSLKSIIAYRTGLAVEPVDHETAHRVFSQLKQSPDQQSLLRKVHAPRELVAPVKMLRDFLLWRALELSIELDLPFQIHTGMGDQDLEIATARPGLLAAVFRDPELRHARIVMLHGSYPFHQEAAYLTNIFPNVYLDLSEFNPFIGRSGVTRTLEAILDLAPFTKLLYASDAYGSPELQWVAGCNARRSLETILGAAVSDGMLTTDRAREAARLVFSENARVLYGV